jgi:DNA-binding MarR family transcriptional regulator
MTVGLFNDYTDQRLFALHFIRHMTETLPRTFQRLPAELRESPLFLLKRLGVAAKERSSEAYEGLGLHPYHHAILALLDEGARETQAAIAEALGYDKGQLVGLLDELEQNGHIERRRDPSDRRRQTVHITPDGRKTLSKMRRLSRELEDDFLATLDDRERAALQALLLRLGEQHLPNCRLAPAPPD